MSKTLSLDNSFDLIFALAAVIGILATLQTFIIGQHYIIPTGTLTLTVVLGNLARYGLRGHLFSSENSGTSWASAAGAESQNVMRSSVNTRTSSVGERSSSRVAMCSEPPTARMPKMS